MKLTVAGKGGSGKSVVTALIARALGERGWMTLAVDLDASPGLAVSLGLEPFDSPLPDEAVEQREDATYGWTMAAHLNAAEVVRRYGMPVGDTVVYLGFGNAASLATPVNRFVTAVRQVASDFHEPGWAVVGDQEAGTTKAFEGYSRFASVALVLVEPTVASVVTAQRILEILAHDGTPAEVVVNQVRTPADVEFVARDLRPLAAIPYDPHLRDLERDARLGELPDASPALAAVRDLVARLEAADAANARMAFDTSPVGGRPEHDSPEALADGAARPAPAVTQWWLPDRSPSG